MRGVLRREGGEEKDGAKDEEEDQAQEVGPDVAGFVVEVEEGGEGGEVREGLRAVGGQDVAVV